MDSQTQRLPNGLLIILHLHLLDFPLQDATGYDERLFDPARGMRERNKAMEDICYFLVGKIEREKERAKAILPTYPCLQPSDTTAFRIALAKYVEAIRNAIVHTTHAGEKPSEQKGKQPASSLHAPNEPAAWWWRDVVVRKSILDECCGERFERLILALSSHAVLKNTNSGEALAPSTLQPLSAQEHAIRSTLPKVYMERLIAAQSERLEWERSAALLVQRQADLAVIRARLADPRHASSSKYDTLETARLLALRDSRHQDLLRGAWGGDDGRRALQLITSLAGLLDPAATSENASGTSVPGRETDLSSSHAGPDFRAPVAAEAPPPLPIAAARHPSHLLALNAPLFPEQNASTSSSSDAPEGAGSSSELPHAITERLAAVDRVQRSLQEALTAAQGIHAQLQRRLQKAKERKAAAGAVAQPKGRKLDLDSSLWSPRAGSGVTFKTPEEAASLLPQLNLESLANENAVEERIAHIRTAVLPPFSAEPEPEPESEPELPTTKPASRLPQPSSRVHPAGTGAGTKPQPRIASQSTKLPPLSKPATRVRVADGSSKAVGKAAKDERARAISRRLSRRASAARTRRSTMFGRGEDAEILRIVASVQDRSDSEDNEDDAEEQTTSQPRTPASRKPHYGTRGTLLSSVKKTGPRQSYDIDVHERAAHVPRLPSLRLRDAPELDEEDPGVDYAAGREHEGSKEEEEAGYAEDDGEDMCYEGNSMTLADILLQAGQQGHTSMQLLGEEELEDEMSDWE
ncbi:hypothetical protein C8Q77DRAFT_1135077 [Trametes polyzona]|nr:hypothetical protein C8Q77DRAFT_1135077 [Trametes polyzona]